jgi:hypothetical protein
MKNQLSKNYTSSFNLNSSNSNQIEKLREKFNKNYADNQSKHLFKKKSNSFRNSVLEANKDDTNILSLKSNSLTDDDYKSYTEQFNHLNKEDNSFGLKRKENPTRNLHKYQKSRTLDLSDSIFNQNENIISQNDNSLIDYKNLIEEIDLDSRYNPENAIIKSTLSFEYNNGRNLNKNSIRDESK